MSRRANHIERMFKGTVVTLIVTFVLLCVLVVVSKAFNDGELNALVIKRTIGAFVGLVVVVYGAGYAVTDMEDDIRSVIDNE